MIMATFPEMSYEELNRWINSAQGGQLAIEERNRRLSSGDATWVALQQAVNQLVAVAPKDHDVLLQVFDIAMLNARYIEPHAFLFEGLDGAGNRVGIVCHFTQLVARVIYLPKRGPTRVITGFAKATGTPAKA